jgi:hypothetical protein
MLNLIRTALALSFVGIVILMLMSAAPVQRGGGLGGGLGRGTGLGQGPVIKRLGTYKGDVFPGFAEFRVHDIEYGDMGDIILEGIEPYDMLVNVTYITTVYRYEDAKKTDYSCLMFTNYQKEPILVRQPYNDVLKSIEKAMDEYSK